MSTGRLEGKVAIITGAAGGIGTTPDRLERPRMNSINHQVRLTARPSGLPKPTDWELTTEPVPVPAAGEFVVAISHLSIDPAMRGWMNAGASYIEPVQIGAVMRAGAIGRVTASEHPGYASGDHVYGAFGVQEFARSDGAGAA
jgi:NADPH-dependent curcumin reductase